MIMTISISNKDLWFQMEAFMRVWPIKPWIHRVYPTLTEKEAKLNLKLPSLMHEWYIRIKHNLPEITCGIQVSDDQSVIVIYDETYIAEDSIEWGIPISELEQANPRVVVRDQRQMPTTWESTETNLSDFLFLVIAWTVYNRAMHEAAYKNSQEFAHGLLELSQDEFTLLQQHFDHWNLPEWSYGIDRFALGGNAELLFLRAGPVHLIAKQENAFSQVEAVVGVSVEIIKPEDED
jgi:hypothetical protein